MPYYLDLILLIIIGFITGIINTIAGGGTLLTLPALIFMGLPPHIANGTNRIAILLQTGVAALGFKSKGISVMPFSIYLGIAAMLGGLIGAQLAVDIRGDLFNKILSVVMIVVMVLIFFQSRWSLIKSEEALIGKPLWISCIIFFFIGIYGGFINAGIGYIMLLVLPYINGLSLVRSNAVKAIVVFFYTASALALFIINDAVDYLLGFVLAIGNASGAWFASRWSVKKGDSFVKGFLLITIAVLAIKLWFF
ncbi:sulfite exporter TauE/SafE family protein [Imtechella halotolerans]|uniref:Probable membrane transporter protein n=1 Tax=Imtechella halotolerans K1 TaxID=946077 RepID=I0WCC7_9FLAO|nr:sulfite exporter TauE/SafE family protein [Imtechella halotolerans]EID74043.1 hypothetical protein W5A_09445 [Imtechella halotolerans K1]WMQ64562.1 sulfite exporter TauE/SafE family protein [Imtechella halotolerans]